MNQRALDLGVELHARLASLGPSARGLSIYSFLTFTLVEIVAATDDELRNIVEDLELNAPQPETTRGWWQWLSRSDKAGRWWDVGGTSALRDGAPRQGSGEISGLRVVVAGPRHPGEPPNAARKP